MDAAAIEEILPPAVVAAELRELPPDAALLPGEGEALGFAVEKRRRDFITGRVCAHLALEQLGLPRCPVLSGPRGEPRWPEGIVGSITHCNGYGAAAVARASDMVTLGIDAEPNEPLPGGVLGHVAFRAELAHLAELASVHDGVCWDRLLFSAKESVYKAWYPRTGRWLGFEDAEVRIDARDGRFVAELPAPAAARQALGTASVSGRWLVRDGLVLTAVALAPSSSPMVAATSATHSSR